MHPSGPQAPPSLHVPEAQELGMTLDPVSAGALPSSAGFTTLAGVEPSAGALTGFCPRARPAKVTKGKSDAANAVRISAPFMGIRGRPEALGRQWGVGILGAAVFAATVTGLFIGISVKLATTFNGKARTLKE
jgi:hypothetical protein